MKITIALIAAPLFLASLFAHIYIKLKMRPGPDLDDYYHEFEDQHPDYARYQKYSQITFTTAAASLLTLFLLTVL